MVVALLQIRKEVAWHENLSDQNLPHSLYDMKIHVFLFCFVLFFLMMKIVL